MGYQMVAQVVRFLPPVWETWVDFQALAAAWPIPKLCGMWRGTQKTGAVCVYLRDKVPSTSTGGLDGIVHLCLVWFGVACLWALVCSLEE